VLGTNGIHPRPCQARPGDCHGRFRLEGRLEVRLEHP